MDSPYTMIHIQFLGNSKKFTENRKIWSFSAFPFQEFKMDKVQEIDDDFQSPHPQDTDAETGPETGPENLDFLQFHFLGKCECEGR